MQIDDCTVTTVIQGINYCVVIVQSESWLDELNKLTPLQVGALLSATALIWFVASGIRQQLDILAHDGDIK